MVRALLVILTVLGLCSSADAQVNSPIYCDASKIYDASTNGATELVPLVTGTSVYVCGYTIFAGGTVSVELDYGTGTACATGNNKLTPAFPLTTQTGAVDGSPVWRGMKSALSNALCIKTNQAVAVQAIVYYKQFRGP